MMIVLNTTGEEADAGTALVFDAEGNPAGAIFDLSNLHWLLTGSDCSQGIIRIIDGRVHLMMIPDVPPEG